MLKSVYTNTGKIGSVVGLLALTVGLSYCEKHSDEIVHGVVKAVSDVKSAIAQTLNPKKEPVHPLYVDSQGNFVTTKTPNWIDRIH